MILISSAKFSSCMESFLPTFVVYVQEQAFDTSGFSVRGSWKPVMAANCTHWKWLWKWIGTYNIQMKICLWCRDKTQQCLDLFFSTSYMSTLYLPLSEDLQQVLWYKLLYCYFPSRFTKQPTKFLSVCPDKKANKWQQTFTFILSRSVIECLKRWNCSELCSGADWEL